MPLHEPAREPTREPTRERTEFGPRDPTAEPPATHYRAIFLSDIHLGTRDCQAETLLSFLKVHTCDRLYLVGDIIDGWRLRSGIYWPQSHSNVLRRFLTAAKRDTQVIYVTGNHDEFLRRYSNLIIGNIHLVDQAEHVTSSGKRMLVLHGDEFDVITRYHRWLAFLGDRGYDLLLAVNRQLNRVREHFGFGHWSLSAWVKLKVKKAVNFISEFEESLAHECRRRGFDGVVCGHIHHAEVRDVDGVRYHNCGDWVESCTALVEQPDGALTVLRWRRPSADVIALPPGRVRKASHERDRVANG